MGEPLFEKQEVPFFVKYWQKNMRFFAKVLKKTGFSLFFFVILY